MSSLAKFRDEESVPLYTGLAELAADFDGYILDLWGVLHDGEQAFPWALDCMARLRVENKRTLILSNAPRRAAAVVERCAELGLTPDTYDALMSSGEDTWRHLDERRDDWYAALGERCYHLGPERDHGMRKGLNYRFVNELEVADFILLTGALDREDTTETYGPILETALGQRLPMVCANPDYVVKRGGLLEICAGAIAQSYEQMGGEVRYHGKPYAGIYRTCLGLFDGIAPQRILAVGDSIRTDIVGAQGMGLQGLFVVSGIHGDVLSDPESRAVDQEKLRALCEAEGGRPIGALPAFRW